MSCGRSSAASAAICRPASSAMRNCPRPSTPPTSGFSSASASSSAISRPTASSPPTSRLHAARRALDDARPVARRHRPHHRRDHDARPNLSGDRRHRAAEAWHASRRSLRHSGRLLRLRLRHGHRRLLSEERRCTARAGHRRRNHLAHPRLDRPHHLRAVRRRRRRGSARTGRRWRARHPRLVAALGRPLRRQAQHHRRCLVDAAPSASSTWKAAKSSATPWARSPTSSRTCSPRPATPVKDLDWFVPHQANRRIIEGAGEKLHIPPEKVVITVDRHANTSAASVPLALTEAVARRPHQARRPGDDRSDGRRLHLGRLADPLVAA